MKKLKVMSTVKHQSEFTPDLTPKYQTNGSVGLDLYAKHRVDIKPGERELISTGIAVELPEGCEGQIRGRSGLASNRGLFCILGTIDTDYRGELKVLLYNGSKQHCVLKAEDRIAQLVISPIEKVSVEVVASLSDTDRGARGFGSTGER